MNGWIGVTENDWFAFFSRQLGIDEVSLADRREDSVPRLILDDHS
jgi:hypothetical protein